MLAKARTVMLNPDAWVLEEGTAVNTSQAGLLLLTPD